MGMVFNAPETFDWDGCDKSGRRLPDGKYVYLLESTDEAGNYGHSEPLNIMVDTREVSSSIDVSPNIFSPGGGGLTIRLSCLLNLKKISL